MKLQLTYDDAVENMNLTQEKIENFTRNVHKRHSSRIRTARRVFYDRMTSTEPWEKTASEKSSLSSLQVLITLIFGAKPCKIHSYCLFCIGSPLVLHQKCIDLSDPHFRDIAAPKSCSRFKGKMTFHSRSSPTAPLMSGAHRKCYERSRFDVWEI